MAVASKPDECAMVIQTAMEEKTRRVVQIDLRKWQV